MVSVIVGQSYHTDVSSSVLIRKRRCFVHLYIQTMMGCDTAMHRTVSELVTVTNNGKAWSMWLEPMHHLRQKHQICAKQWRDASISLIDAWKTLKCRSSIMLSRLFFSLRFDQRSFNHAIQLCMHASSALVWCGTGCRISFANGRS